MVSKDEMNYIKEAIVTLVIGPDAIILYAIILQFTSLLKLKIWMISLHYVKDFVSNTVGVKDVEIEAAHRTPTFRLKQNADNPHPRIIHAKLLKRSDWD